MSKVKKILIIEDDAFLSSIYTKKMEDEGFEIFASLDGVKGLKLAKQKVPDLVLLDLILPVMDGFTVLENIRKDENIKDMPVILLTNLSSPEDIKRGQELNVKNYIIKMHFTPQEVVEKVKEVLSRKL